MRTKPPAVNNLKSAPSPSKATTSRPERRISPSHNQNSLVLIYTLGSFVVGMLAILLPFVISFECSLAEHGHLSWPISRLVQLKCGYYENLQSVSHPAEYVAQPPQAIPNEAGSSSVTINSSPLLLDYTGKLQIFAAGYCIKKAQSTSANECGEDAFSLGPSRSGPTSGRTFFAVADGVGGWSASGGDSSKISVGFLEELKGIVNSTRLSLSESAQLAFARMASQGTYKQGSTTVCAALLDHDTGMLHISNVGDSGAFVFRDGRVILKTKLGVEGFNAPYQIGFDQEGRPYGSFAAMETRYSVKLVPGDIIVLATDGVLDNLYDEELREMVQAMVGPVAYGPIDKKHPSVDINTAVQERVKSASTTLAWHSWARSQESHWVSPFALSAVLHGFAFSGGKQDDITIVVAVIRSTL